MGLVISKGLTLRKEFQVQPYMWEFPQQYGLWSPAEISTALWLDAADSSTVTTVSGAVSQWNDKSGNARHVVQATAGSRPTYSAAAINSKNAVSFNGTSNFLLNANEVLLRNASKITVCSVVRLDDNALERWFLFVRTATLATRLGLGFKLPGVENLGYGAGGRRLDADSFQAFGSGGYNSSTAIYGTTISYDIASARNFENGTQTINATFQTAGNTSATGGSFFIGVQASTLYFQGLIGEIVFIEGVYDDVLRQKTEGYLAHKWGLTASLPSDHPYKTVGPTP